MWFGGQIPKYQLVSALFVLLFVPPHDKLPTLIRETVKFIQTYRFCTFRLFDFHAFDLPLSLPRCTFCVNSCSNEPSPCGRATFNESFKIIWKHEIFQNSELYHEPPSPSLMSKLADHIDCAQRQYQDQEAQD